MRCQYLLNQIKFKSVLESPLDFLQVGYLMEDQIACFKNRVLGVPPHKPGERLRLLFYAILIQENVN